MPLILALDDPAKPLQEIVGRLCGVVDGFKVGVPLVVALGGRAVCRLRRLCPGALWIADMKLADIASTMILTASQLVDCVDAIIAHSIVGVKGALGELKEYLDRHNVKLILVVAMSHPGAVEVYNKLLEENIAVVRRVNAWGVVAPATMPEVVARVRRELPGKTILSPGVGVQGAKPGAALCAGADYEIVGRLIVEAEDPYREALKVLQMQREAAEKCAAKR